MQVATSNHLKCNMLELLLALAFTPRPASWSVSRPSQRARLAVTPRLGPLSWVEDKIFSQLAKRRWDEQLAKRPGRIILVRHGQSQGNVDDKIYSTVPDSQIALTERGFAQAVVAGLQIRSLVGNGTVRCFYSPYLRTKQTMLAILQAFDSQRVLLSSEPRLREQDFGNFQNLQDMKGVFQERQKFGALAPHPRNPRHPRHPLRRGTRCIVAPAVPQHPLTICVLQQCTCRTRDTRRCPPRPAHPPHPPAPAAPVRRCAQAASTTASPTARRGRTSSTGRPPSSPTSSAP